ncbi:MAG: glycosyltransferase family 4 protein [Candidatus Alcyoniella australis]|nr:glycosyltransferase family 4 protein [Candidatus Alcyoniella australis]
MSARIVYVHTDPLPSAMAGSVFALRTAIGMAQAGLNTLLIMPTAGIDPKQALQRYGVETLPPGLRIELTAALSTRLGPLSIGRQRRFADQVARLSQSFAPQALVVRTLTLADRLLRQGVAAPLIYEAHNWYADLDAKWRGAEELVTPRKLRREARLAAVEARVVPRVAGLVLLQQAMREPFEQAYPGCGPINVLPSGLEIPPQLPQPASDPLAVYLGQLHPHKGLGTMLEALIHAPQLRLLVIGGPALLEHWRSQAAKLGVAQRVEFTGNLPHSQVATQLARARIGVAPLRDCFYNRHLTSPMKVLEYFSAGLPVVGSDLPTVAELVGDERGLLVPPDDPRALAGALLRLIDDQELYSTMRSKIAASLDSLSWRARGAGFARLIRLPRQ